MWPFGHLAVGYLAYALYSRWRGESPDTAPALVLAFASLLPDLIDKPLAWYLGVLPTGRSLAHSLVVMIPVCVAVFAVAHRYGRDREGTVFAIGVLSHIIADALPWLWDGEETVAFLLWPLLPVEPGPEGTPDPLDLLLSRAGEPYFILEFVLLAVAFVWWRRHGYPGAGAFSKAASR